MSSFFWANLIFIFLVASCHPPEIKRLTLIDELKNNQDYAIEYMSARAVFNEEQELIILSEKIDLTEFNHNDIFSLSASLKKVMPHFIVSSNLWPDELEYPVETEAGLKWKNAYLSDKNSHLLSSDKKMVRQGILLPYMFSENDLTRILSSLKHNKDYRHHVLGIAPFRIYLFESAKNYVFLLLPVIAVLTMLCLWWFFNALTPAIISILVLGSGSFVTFFANIIYYGGLSALSSVGLLIVFVVGTSDIIHVLAAIARNNTTNKDSLARAFNSVKKPCFYTSLTTIIGFSSFLFSELKTLVALGISCIVGIGSCYLFTFYILPIVLNRLASRSPKLLVWGISKTFAPKKLIFRFSGLFSVLFVTMALLAIPLIFNIDFKDDHIKKFNDSHSYTLAANKHLEHFGTLDRIDLVFKKSIKTTERWDSFHLELQQIPDIQKILDVDLLKETALGGIKTPQLKLKFLASAKDSKGMMFFQNKDFERILIQPDSNDDPQIISLFHKILSLKEKYWNGEDFHVLSFAYVRARFFENFREQLTRSLAFTLVTILLILFYLYRSIRIVLIAMLVNLTPVLIVLGVFSFLGTKANINLAILITVLLGLAVDDTIHYLHHNRFKVDQPDPLISVPVIITSLLLILGFFLVSIGQVRVFTEVSRYMCLGLLLALLGDVVLLPYLLKVTKRN